MPENITGLHVIVFIVVAISIIIASYYLYRWIFEVDRKVQQNDAIIGLLKKIAEKQGVTQDEIHNATTEPYKFNQPTK